MNWALPQAYAGEKGPRPLRGGPPGLTLNANSGYASVQMALEIPIEEVSTIAAIRTLPVASVDDLIAALAGAPLISDPKEMTAYIAKQLPSLSAKQLSPVLDTLYMLYYIRGLSGATEGRFLNDLMDGIHELPDLKLTHQDLAKLRARFKKLLSINTLTAISKAARLQRDGERLYCESKILSDIRPVFGPDPTASPVGAVLTHTLKLLYHLGKEHKEFHVVLDSDDLEALNDVIIRARFKDKSLRNFLDSTKLPNLGD